MKIFILGSSGLLGRRLQKYLQKQSKFELHCFVRNEQYPCNNSKEIYNALNIHITELKPDVIINLVALTNVDSCEKNLLYTSLINTEFNHILSDLCRINESIRPYIVYISSDQVYSGSGPHSEHQENPVNIYGLTKLLGEYPILRDNGCVLRTNFFGKSLSPYRTSFSDWLIRNSHNNLTSNVFSDVLFSPIGIESLCQQIVLCLELRIRGLFNLGSNSAGISKADFSRLLYIYLGLNKDLLNNVSLDSGGLSANRPKDMRMNSLLFSKTTGFTIPTIEEEIDRECYYYLQCKD